MSKVTPDAMAAIREYSIGEPRLPTPWNWEHGNYWRLTEVAEDGLVRIEKMPWWRWADWQRCTPHTTPDWEIRYLNCLVSRRQAIRRSSLRKVGGEMSKDLSKATPDAMVAVQDAR